jgi:hypothetical protein
LDNRLSPNSKLIMPLTANTTTRKPMLELPAYNTRIIKEKKDTHRVGQGARRDLEQ